MMFFEKDDKYYIPTKEYFNIENRSFNPVGSEEIVNAVNNYSFLDLFSIKDSFNIDGIEYNPLDYINLAQCKLCTINEKAIDKINVKYSPDIIEYDKFFIKLKNTISANYKDFLDIKTNNKNYIMYNIDSKNDKPVSNIDTEIINKKFNLTFKFNNKDAVLSSIYIKEYENFILNRINKNDFTLSANLLNTKLTFKNNINRLYVNRITKQKFKYASDTLETF